MGIENSLTQQLVEHAYRWQSFGEMRQRRAAVLVREAIPALTPDQRILEIGTGKGDVFIHLCQRYPRQVVSLDIEEQVVSPNRQSQFPRVIADGLRIPFANDTFDLTFMCFVLHHLPTTKAMHEMVEEALRVAPVAIITEDCLDKNLLGSRALRGLYVRSLDCLLNLGVPGGSMANQKTTEEWLGVFRGIPARLTDTRRFPHPVLGILPQNHIVYTLRKTQPLVLNR